MLTSANLTARLLGQRLSMTIILILGVFVSLVAFTGIIGITKKKEYFMISVSWINKNKTNVLKAYFLLIYIYILHRFTWKIKCTVKNLETMSFLTYVSYSFLVLDKPVHHSLCRICIPDNEFPASRQDYEKDSR